MILSRVSWSGAWNTAIYNTYVIYESCIYHVDTNYSTITSLRIAPAIHSCQWTKQFPPLRHQPWSKWLLSARVTFNRDFSEEIKHGRSWGHFSTHPHAISDDATMYHTLIWSIFEGVCACVCVDGAQHIRPAAPQTNGPDWETNWRRRTATEPQEIWGLASLLLL